jgi:hypothetical protein
LKPISHLQTFFYQHSSFTLSRKPLKAFLSAAGRQIERVGPVSVSIFMAVKMHKKILFLSFCLKI